MDSNVNKFNQAYAQIINQSLFKKMATGLGKMVGMSGNKMIHKTLAKTLKNYGFEIEDADEQNFSDASKVISRNVKDKETGNPITKYYKITITNDYNQQDKSANFAIKCSNAVTEKKVKIKSQNFKLNTGLTSDEIVTKVINPCIAPLKITKDPSEDDAARQAKKALEQKQADEKNQREAADKEAKQKQQTEKQDQQNIKAILSKYSQRVESKLKQLKQHLATVPEKLRIKDSYKNGKQLFSEFDDIDDDKSMSAKDKAIKFKEFSKKIDTTIQELDSLK